MRIVPRADFLRLPIGTVFRKGQPCFLGNLSIKGETLFNNGGQADFYYHEVGDPEAASSEDYCVAFDEQQDGTFPHRTVSITMERDGMFDDLDLFMVMDSADIQTIISMLRALAPPTATPAKAGAQLPQERDT